MALVSRLCACGHSWDDLVGVVSEGPSLNCPKCGAASIGTKPGTFAHRSYGIETMTPGEIALARENKASVEAAADDVRSGAIGLSTKSTVPLELRPEIPKTLH